MRKKVIKFKFNNPISEGKKMVAKKAKKKRTPKQIAATKKLVAGNKKRAKVAKAKKAPKKKPAAKKKAVKSIVKKAAKKKVVKKAKRSPKQIAATKRMVAARKAQLKGLKKKTSKKKVSTKRKATKKKSSVGTTRTIASKLKSRDKKKEVRVKRVKTRNKMKRGDVIVQTWKGGGRKKGKKHVKWDKMLLTKRTNPSKKRKLKKRKNPMGGTMAKFTKKIQDYTQHNVSEMGGLFAGGMIHQFSNDMVTKFMPKVSKQMEGKLGAYAGSVTPILFGALLTKFGGKNAALKSLAKGLVGSGIVGLGLASYEVVAPSYAPAEMEGYDADLVMHEGDAPSEDMGVEYDDFGALETEDFGAIETEDFSGEEDYYDSEMGTES